MYSPPPPPDVSPSVSYPLAMGMIRWFRAIVVVFRPGLFVWQRFVALSALAPLQLGTRESGPAARPTDCSSWMGQRVRAPGRLRAITSWTRRTLLVSCIPGLNSSQGSTTYSTGSLLSQSKSTRGGGYLWEETYMHPEHVLCLFGSRVVRVYPVGMFTGYT